LVGSLLISVPLACTGTVGLGSAVDSDAGGDSGFTGADAGPTDAGIGDTYLPWEGGPGYYSHWSDGPPSNPNYFPIAVWLQSASNARAYKAIGINTYIGLSQDTTNAELAGLKDAGVQTICDPDLDWMSHLTDPTIDGWRIPQDEPDNAQAVTDGGSGYGPCIDPTTIVSEYDARIAADPTRPVFLNLGQGVAYIDYPGRGSACAGQTSMYPMYAAGADLLSFDIYPVNNTDATTGGNLWYVATGVDNLRSWAAYQKPVWNWIETTGIDNPTHTPTPAQIRTEVWMSLVHGSMGIGYFCHIFSPSFIEAGLLSVAANAAAVGAINHEIETLAPVLNSRSLSNGATASSSNAVVPVDIMVKRYAGNLYVFAVAMRPGATVATFTLRGITTATATVLGESRAIQVAGGSFSDTFAPYEVHLYEVGP
jgi:hypothetical protein